MVTKYHRHHRHPVSGTEDIIAITKIALLYIFSLLAGKNGPLKIIAFSFVILLLVTKAEVTSNTLQKLISVFKSRIACITTSEQ